MRHVTLRTGFTSTSLRGRTHLTQEPHAMRKLLPPTQCRVSLVLSLHAIDNTSPATQIVTDVSAWPAPREEPWSAMIHRMKTAFYW